MHAWILVDGRLEYTSEVEAVKHAHGTGQRLWVDLEEQTPELEALLADTFRLHPLVVEDMWLERSVPKIEDFDKGKYLYLVVHGLSHASRPPQLDLYVLDIVFSSTFVITQHSKVLTPHHHLTELASTLARGTPWLVHALLDHLIDQYIPAVADLARQADDLELDIFRGTGSDEAVLQKIYELRRGLQKLCRITDYQKDILQRLAHGAYDDLPTDVLPYFRDVQDHFVRVADQVETSRDVVGNTMEAFLGLQSNRLNATMKTLATISTIMLPLSFIASVYGMNFHYMPELAWRWGYPYALTLMVVVATSLIVWFKRRRWL